MVNKKIVQKKTKIGWLANEVSVNWLSAKVIERGWQSNECEQKKKKKTKNKKNNKEKGKKDESKCGCFECVFVNGSIEMGKKKAKNGSVGAKKNGTTTNT